MNQNYVSKEDLHELFTKTDLIETNIVPYTKPTKKITPIKRMTINNLTPISKLIYESSNAYDKQKLLIDFAKDNEYIDKVTNSIDENDPDYLEKMENNKLGFYMEDFVCHNMKCPSCGEKMFKKYMIKNMPVVDVICTNVTYHENKSDVYMFQIKITVGNNNYFSKYQNYILVGSKKYGFNCHEIYGSDNIYNKKLLVGYICLQLYMIKDNEYKIDKKESFIILPDTNKTTNLKYYEYLDKTGSYNRNILKWNNNMIKEVNIINVCDEWLVNTNVVYYDINLLDNPYNESSVYRTLQFAGNWKKKYNKYKKKYLELKKLDCK